MLTRFIPAVQYFIFPGCVPVYLAGILIFAASPLWAQTFDPTLTIGAGIQGSYEHLEPANGSFVDQFTLDHLRLYFSGDITKNVSAMVNTDYSSVTNTMELVDAVGEFHDTPMFNVWFGRFLPPAIAITTLALSTPICGRFITMASRAVIPLSIKVETMA